MKVNLNTISRRAKEILDNPQFQNPEIDSEFELTLDASDRILTVFHQGKSGEVELIFSEVLSVFAKNRTIFELWKINYREVENFLRDENHLLAFGEAVEELERSLNLTKISMIADGLKNRFPEKITTLKEMMFDWENLTLTAKNQWALEFLELIGAQLIFCDNTTLSFKKFPTEVPGSDLEMMVQKILGGGEIILPMKVVAV